MLLSERPRSFASCEKLFLYVTEEAIFLVHEEPSSPRHSFAIHFRLLIYILPLVSLSCLLVQKDPLFAFPIFGLKLL